MTPTNGRSNWPSANWGSTSASHAKIRGVLHSNRSPTYEVAIDCPSLDVSLVYSCAETLFVPHPY